jgi:hypothetical protein
MPKGVYDRKASKRRLAAKAAKSAPARVKRVVKTKKLRRS